ncbi:FAD/FMN-containing dehydrogenase [Cohaesibacter sp. ES.047]|uniref:FAD-binding oxidoreductase n=1 Tax=Cohaesibacter sp. ES.047 TaxID=1798205 RepID=UPI000BB77900|nr:FAD-binding oxidoreductase [Cohaesibacter sp. ES.047]SNY94397.1 FAD/FMN-containing dehydrogenase [Cohaesibacter sp. ES.047]
MRNTPRDKQGDIPGNVLPQTLKSALAALLGPSGFMSGASVPSRNHGDASVMAGAKPLAVLRPQTTEELAEAVKLCAEQSVAITVQGGLTGLCGGAIPSPGSVALSLERMNKILSIDPVAMTATIEAGVPLQALQQAAEKSGLLCPVDFGARGSCTIGGTVATNAGGTRVLRYGMTRQSVLGLEVVLADGSILDDLSPMLKNNAGFDLKQLFIGSEGSLGVVTRVVLALQPKPGWSELAMVATRDFDSAMQAFVRARRKLGPRLSTFEVMWPDYWSMVTQNVTGCSDPFPDPHDFYFLIEASGPEEAGCGAVLEAYLSDCFEAGIVEDAVLAKSLSETERLWAIRDASAEIEPVLGEHESFDISLPIHSLGPFAQACRTALNEAYPQVRAVFFGHAADGNLHIMASVPMSSPAGHTAIEKIIYDLARSYRGSISAEHGIGALKRPWLGHSRSPLELALMQNLKTTLDPNNLLNPGKVLP